MDFIVRQKSFWAEDDESVLRAIREGFIQTHQAMWKELGKTSDICLQLATISRFMT
jgi:protein phosphatase 1D